MQAVLSHDDTVVDGREQHYANLRKHTVRRHADFASPFVERTYNGKRWSVKLYAIGGRQHADKQQR